MASATGSRRWWSTFSAPLVLLGLQMVVFPMPAGVYLQGLTLGLLGALVAVGMCLIYRTNRIINFAQNALGLVPTVVAVELAVYSGVNLVLAGVVGAVLATLLGLVVHRFLIRRFATSSRLILTVATIGIAQACLGISLMVPRLWGHDTRAEQVSFGWTFDLAVDPLRFHVEHLLAWFLAPTILAVVGFVLLRTRFGAAVRAAADRPERAAMLGIPVDRVQGVVWAGAALLSFVGVFLRVAVVGLPFASTESFTALLAVLAALTLGRFTNLAQVAATAVVLGIVEQSVTWNHPENPQLYAVVLAAVIFVGLAVMGAPSTRLDRHTASAWQDRRGARPLPAALARRPAVRMIRAAFVVVVLAVAVDLPWHLGTGDQLKAATVLVFAIVGVSLVVLTGWAGLVSLGQMGFVAVGASVGAWLTTTQGDDLAVGLIGAALAGGVTALLVGLPALRLRGLYLAVVTLAFNVATAAYLLNPAYARWIPDGRVPRAPLLGLDLSSERSMYWLCLAVLGGVCWSAHAIRTGRPGRAFVAQRDNQLASESYGMSTTRTRLTAFSLSGAVASVAGCLLVHVLQAYPDQLLTPERSLTTFGATVVGGIASPIGAVIGALVFVASGWFLGDAARILSTSVGLLLVLVAYPSGIAGAASAARNRLLRRWIVSPSDPADHPDRPRQTEQTEQSDPVPGAAVPALRVRDLRVSIDGALIVDAVSFEVASGGILALLGTNGAGKSTVLNAVSGILPIEAGSVELDGVEVAGRSAHRIAGLGIGQAPGGRGVFPSLTVAEHLTLAGWGRPPADPFLEERTAGALDAFEPLRRRLHEHAANLSGGEQQMLVLAMAWVSRPSVLLIDELSLGLAPIVVDQLLGFLHRIRSAGTTVVLVEQSLVTAAALADRAVFLERGRVVFRGPTEVLLERPDLARSIHLAPTGAGSVATGRADDSAARPPRRDGVAIQASAVSVRYGGVDALSDVDLAVASGEVVGLIGPNGAGKSTLLDALSGLHPLDHGGIDLNGRSVAAVSFSGRARRGLGRSFQDAALFPTLTVEEALAVACDRSVEVVGVADAVLRTPAQRRSEASVRRRVDELVGQFHLTGQREQPIADLSTGQRRIVDLAALVAWRPDVVLLDEPSSGLAHGEVEALGPLLRRLHRELGLTMIVVEHDLPLIAALADRLVVLDQGRTIASGPPDDVLADPAVVAAYLGTARARQPEPA